VNPRRLTLRTERLAELTTDDLHSVAGAAPQQTILCTGLSVLANCQSVNYCTTAMSCGCQPSWNCQ
jgi:hypothetical protein